MFIQINLQYHHSRTPHSKRPHTLKLGKIELGLDNLLNYLLENVEEHILVYRDLLALPAYLLAIKITLEGQLTLLRELS